ncbi:MAG: 2Fe-2S iron-sulfur cluster-binding protein, partial [Aestuariivirga sp.]
MTAVRRLEKGGRIDRTKAISFTYDGKPLNGFAGDTLASALLANGKTLTSRSFKYHRPRGIVSAGVEEPNGLFTLGNNEPNIPATTVDLTEGLTVKSQNAWPSPDFDVMAVNSLLAPMFQSGFYYKTFM